MKEIIELGEKIIKDRDNLNRELLSIIYEMQNTVNEINEMNKNLDFKI